MRGDMKAVVVGLLLMLAAGPVACREIEGTVIDVQDGDSFVLRDTQGREVTVRMAECDAPEYRQNYADEARRHLRRLIEGRQVVVLTTSEDRYGRVIGRVYRGEQDVNRAMVSAGYAWANLPYLTEREFLRLEAGARQARRGLWADRDKPVEPWLWREARRAEAGQTRDTPATTQSPAQPGCRIKGNIGADGARRYHVPGSRSYDDTRIDSRKGERWFCSEAEAEAAGWQRAGRR